VPSIWSRSYAGSSGPKHSSQIERGSTGYVVPQIRHRSAWGFVIVGAINP
jgi:hypothetical protein